MKKLVGAFMMLSILLFCLPCGPHAVAQDAAYVIDMHGTRTYLGTTSNWAKTWDASNFKDVTTQDVTCDGSLTVKAGTVKNLDVESGSLTVSGGTILSVNTCGPVSMTGGTIRGNVVANGDNISLSGNFGIGGSLNAGQSVTFSSGKISVGSAVTAGQSVNFSGGTAIVGGAVNADQSVTFGAGTVSVGGAVNADQSVTFSAGTVSVGGAVKGINVTFNPSVNAKIAGSIKSYDTIKIGDCTLTAGSIDCANQGTLEINGYKNTLPQLTNMTNIVLDEKSKTVCKQPLQAHSLTLKNGSEFTAYAGIVLDTLDGPGTLCINPGSLTVHYDIEDSPSLVFNGPVGNGTVAFQSDGWSIPTTSVNIIGYNLTSTTSGSSTVYRLNFSGSSGIAFDTHSIDLNEKGSATIRAEIAPNLSQYADGTKLVWELHGDSTGILIAPSNQTCNITSSKATTGNHRAVVIAYLVDRNGTCLNGYRADSCAISQSGASDYKLDTTVVSVLTGDRYGILAMGGNDVKPAATSSNTSVATLDGGVEVKDKNGNKAWVFSVTGGTAGVSTIDIGGQKVIVSVDSGILMDTLDYTMSPGAKYCIGVTIKGIAQNDLNVSSTNSCASVKFLRKEKSGKLLYQITGSSAGKADIIFQIANGQSVKTAVTVENGSASNGRSARLVALKQ